MKKVYPLLIIILLFAIKSERIEIDLKYISSIKDYDDFYRTELARLSEKHSAKLVSITESLAHSSMFSFYLGKRMIIDTMVVKSYQRGGEYFIKTANLSSNRFLCDLKCSRELFSFINKTDGKHFLIAMKPNTIKSEQNIVELDSIDNKSLFVNNGQNIFVAGECIDAVEIPFSLLFTTN